MARSFVLIALAVLVSLTAVAVRADDADGSAPQAAAKIDELLTAHWKQHELEPAAAADDAELLRRLTLDLAGRIPTEQELDAFLADKSADKRRQAIKRLMTGPEFSLHFGRVLDEQVQGAYAGEKTFLDYLRRSVRERKSWDAVFREIMIGPWDDEQTRPANRFLDKRAKNVDVLTVDATRVFFGVDITCAQCHDHPLVLDWSQDHFYGMMAFFNRTTGGKGQVGEKKDGEVTFLSGGKEKTAKVMFLSGRVIEDQDKEKDKDAKSVSRRAQLVDAALADRTYFSRAIVNRMWEYFFGRGLVSPVDQMHSENKPSVPGLLEWLADDFADHGYDLNRLVETLVSTRAYQLSSRWEHAGEPPNAGHFAVARLRPLSPQQMAVSLLLATGDGRLSPPGESDRRIETYTGVAGLSRMQERLALEDRAETLARHFDPSLSEFQSSAGEALFFSNAAEAQELFQAQEDNLPARLAQIDDTQKLVRAAILAVLSRAAEDEESAELAAWFDQQSGDRGKACEQLVWVLAGSAEFRFNH